MASSQLLTFYILFVCYFGHSSAESFSCTSASGDKTVNLEIQYDREEVGVYKYNNTNLINVLVPSVKVEFKDNSSDSESIFSTPSLDTTIDGLATLTKENVLQECDLVLRANGAESGDYSMSVQRELFSSAKSCIESTLCDRLGEITEDDVNRANSQPYDFGENTVLFNLINERYPNIQLPKKKDKSSSDFVPSREFELQSTLNSLLDFVLTGAISFASNGGLGIIKLPDYQKDLGAKWPSKEGYFNMLNGSFGDLTNVLRTENVEVSNDGLRYTLSIGIQLPNAKISYDKYALKYSIISRSGTASITVNDIALGAQIVVNYNTVPCKISAGYIRSRVNGINFKLSNGGFADVFINEIVNLAVHRFTNNIVDLLKTTLQNFVSNALGNLDCEKFRPRLN